MIVDESERSLHDALCVLTQTVKETRTVFGGGALLHFLLHLTYFVTLLGFIKSSIDPTVLPSFRKSSIKALINRPFKF